METSEKKSGQQDKVDSGAGERGWLFPDRRAQSMPAGLYIVATPIGNMGDMSFRALDVLTAVDVVFCEDTRVSGKLLSYYGIEAQLQVYNDHSTEKTRSDILKRIEKGQRVALISDAGMPLISDPGYKLVLDLRVAGVDVFSVPGANAPLAALQLSGMPSDAFSFLGFLPAKSEARKSALEPWRAVPSTLIAFETAPRLMAALRDIAAVMGTREVCVVREITKKFEEVRRGSVEELLAHYEEQGTPKGEIVLVIAPPGEQRFSDVQIEQLLKDALKTQSTKDAAAEISDVTGVPKKDLYQRALKLKGDV